MSYSFSNQEKKRIFDLVSKLIGTFKIANEGAEIFLNNIERRMYLNNQESLDDYLNFASQNPVEHGFLISSLTIHTTYWFRESGHFETIEDYFTKERPIGKLRALSVGCSTGEEVYSLALVLDSIRKRNPGFDYEIIGMDIDPVSVDKGARAIYDARELSKIPRIYHDSVLLGSGKTAGMMTLSKEIRDRVRFVVGNARSIPNFDHSFDLALCRNMLIYFDEDSVNEIVASIASKLNPSGMMVLGHSESFTRQLDCEKLGGSVFISKPSHNSNEIESLDSLNSSDDIDLISLNLSQDDLRLSQQLSKGKIKFHEAKRTSELSTLLKAPHNVKVLLIKLADQLPDDLFSLLDTQLSKQQTLAKIVVHSDSLEKDIIARLQVVVDELIPDSKVRFGLDKFESHLSKMIDLKKAGGSFSQLPVAVVDDDDFISEIFKSILEDAGFKVVTFDAGEKLLDYIRSNPIQALISDFRMPTMTGTDLIEKLNQIRSGIPVIIASGFSRDIDKGVAYKVLAKPVDGDVLVETVQQALLARYSGQILKLDESRVGKLDLLVMGGSTGAPQIFQKILSQLPKPFPPTVVVQHIPAQFQMSFAEDLSKISGLDLKIVDNKMQLEPNTIYFAQQDHHVVLSEEGRRIYIESNDDAPYKGLRPCVHHLFESTAQLSTRQVLGVLLTGMGDDGSHALGKMRDSGQYTIVQDLTSSTVFGMPKVAIDNDNVDYIGTHQHIQSILRGLKAA